MLDCTALPTAPFREAYVDTEKHRLRIMRNRRGLFLGFIAGSEGWRNGVAGLENGRTFGSRRWL
jgi:hypothetical protein